MYLSIAKSLLINKSIDCKLEIVNNFTLKGVNKLTLITGQLDWYFFNKHMDNRSNIDNK